MSSIKFSVSGHQKVQLRMNRLSKKIKNPVPLWNKLDPKIKAQIKRQFDSQGAELGTPWKKLKSKTVIQKLKLGLNNGILRRTRELSKSFITKTKNRFELVIGAKGEQEKKLSYHQLGTKKIPKRPVLNVSSPKFLTMLRKEIKNYIRSF